MFAVNDILVFEKEGSKKMERILWIDEGGIICYSVSLDNRSNLPQKRVLKNLEDLYFEGAITFEDSDPYYIDAQLVPSKYLEIRENRWNIINSIVDQEPDIFEAHKRSLLIKKISEKTGVSKKQLYKYLTQFWRKGKTKDALLPDYHRCGNKGEKRHYKVKTGRNRTTNLEYGPGIIINEMHEAKLLWGIKNIYLKQDKKNMQLAYDMTMNAKYSLGTTYENNKRKSLLLPLDQRPTYSQFRRCYKKHFGLEKTWRKREGDKKFELNHKLSLNSSVGSLFGPGSQFQIDGTPSDISLVSSLDRSRIVGRPMIYSIMDTFSRMIVGIYVGFEGDSWNAAMMAIANAVSNKVSYCKSFGIDIKEEQWLSHHLPQSFLGDNGPMKSINSNGIIETLHVSIENHPTYRADLKGIIERGLGRINQTIKPLLPGRVDTERKIRGERDYRLDSSLTLNELTKAVILYVLFYNNSLLKNYDRDEMVLSEDVSPIPTELWKWGVKYRTGKLRKYSENKVKLTLLPNQRVKVTADGISFHHAFYVNERAIKEEWLLKKDKVLDISYDPRNISKIYIKDRNYKNGYEVAYLTGHSSRYKNKTYQEVQQLFKTEKLLKADLKELQMQSKMDFYNRLAEIGEEAEAQTKAAQKQGISNNKKLKGVRKNKANEKRYGEYNDAFDLSDIDEIKKEINPSELNQVVDDSNKALDSKTNNNEDDYLEALKNQSEEFYNESSS